MAANLQMLGNGNVLRRAHLEALPYATVLALAGGHRLRKTTKENLVGALADGRMVRAEDEILEPDDLKVILEASGVPRAEWSRLRAVRSLHAVLVKWLAPPAPAPRPARRSAPLAALAVNADATTRDSSLNDADKLVQYLRGSEVLAPGTDLLGVTELSGAGAQSELVRAAGGYVGHGHQLHYEADRAAILWREEKLELAENAGALPVVSRRHAELARVGSQKHMYAVLKERGGARRTVAVVNVHLPSAKNRRSQTDALTNLARDVETLQEAVDAVLVLGDFNMQPDTIREYLPDACRHLAFDEGIENLGAPDARFERQRRHKRRLTHEIVGAAVHLPEM